MKEREKKTFSVKAGPLSLCCSQFFTFFTEQYFILLTISGVGLSMVRAAIFAANAYNFEGQALDMSLAVAIAGFSAGWIVVTPLASHLFSKYYGFNHSNPC